MTSDIFKESDKSVSAYLLTRRDIEFLGTEANGDILYFLFSPSDKARRYGEQFMAKATEMVQPKELLEAWKTVTNIIWKWRNDAGRYSKPYEYR